MVPLLAVSETHCPDFDKILIFNGSLNEKQDLYVNYIRNFVANES